MQVESQGQEDALEEGMTIHSSILAWRILWTEEPGGLQSLGSHGVDRTERLTCKYLYRNVLPQCLCFAFEQRSH